MQKQKIKKLVPQYVTLGLALLAVLAIYTNFNILEDFWLTLDADSVDAWYDRYEQTAAAEFWKMVPAFFVLLTVFVLLKQCLA